MKTVKQIKSWTLELIAFVKQNKTRTRSLAFLVKCTFFLVALGALMDAFYGIRAMFALFFFTSSLKIGGYFFISNAFQDTTIQNNQMTKPFLRFWTFYTALCFNLFLYEMIYLICRADDPAIAYSIMQTPILCVTVIFIVHLRNKITHFIDLI